MLKKVLIVVGALIGVAALVIVGFIVFINMTWQVDYSDTPYPKLGALDDPEKIARGKYLVEAVSHCARCHAPNKEADTIRPSDYPAPTGGYVWDIPPFGKFTSPNLTPHKENGIGRYKPEEVARAIKTGVRPDGSLGVLMLFGVRSMSDADVEAIVAYLYSQPPVDRPPGVYEPGFIGKVVVRNLAPREHKPPPHAPPGEVSAKRGEYLAKGPAACFGCHTPHDILAGATQSGPDMSGGTQADPDPKNPKMEMHAPNLTPDPKTGHLRDWDEAKFLERFSGAEAFVGTPMPWGSFMGMTVEDKKSLWLYLQSLEPVERDTGPVYRELGSFRPGS
jgi:mono/diheme cytochrome c family protein